MGKVNIDGQWYEVDESKDLLQVCLELGFNLPYFCWHPALGSVGACRQCAVKQFKDENDEHGKIVMACMTAAHDGARFSIEDDDARDFRAGVIEWLMVNHPHDCPVCDEGGECHLQDMTVMAGHTYREYRFNKRTFRNQNLGPLVNHEMNRCIQCYRCVRFYRDYAGGGDLHEFASHDHVYFGRHGDGPLESEFSGNLVEICPTGVFTDKTLKHHYTRKWDLQTAPSVCTHCGLGCNTTPGERYQTLRRVRARYHSKVNGYFLCDRGRYGYLFANDERRLRAPLRPAGEDAPAGTLSKDDATAEVASWLQNDGRAIGLGSPRASLEANFALRSLVGPDNFYAGVTQQELDLLTTVRDILEAPDTRAVSLREIESCDAVLILGEDLTNTAPMAALAVRQAARNMPKEGAAKAGIPGWHAEAILDFVQDRHGPLWIATPMGTKLDPIATTTAYRAPEDIARLGYAIANAMDSSVPAPNQLDGELDEAAKTIAEGLAKAKSPLVISGTSLGSKHVLDAAARVAWAAKAKRDDPAALFLTVPEANSLGLTLLANRGLEAASDSIASDSATVFILENDLYTRAPEPTVTDMLERATRAVVIDYLAHPTAARANVVLPSGTFAEADGTLVNNEGRAQRFFQVFVPEAPIQESWRWIRDIAAAAGVEPVKRWQSLDDVLAALADADPVFSRVPDAAPNAKYRLAGSAVPREPYPYTGRTAMYADREIHEPKPPGDPDAPFTFSMEGYQGQPPGAVASHFWAPGWNSIQALNRFQEEIAGPLRGGEGGVRLIESASNGSQPPATDAPAPYAARDGEFRLVPVHHIFGSEELSALSPPIAELAPAPYVALGDADAKRLNVTPGERVRLHAGEHDMEGTVRIAPELAPGVAGVPVGPCGYGQGPLPAYGTVQKVAS